MTTATLDRHTNHDGITTETTNEATGEITSTTVGARSPDGRFLKWTHSTVTKILKVTTRQVTTRQLAWAGLFLGTVATMISVALLIRTLHAARTPTVQPTTKQLSISAAPSATFLSMAVPTVPTKSPLPQPTSTPTNIATVVRTPLIPNGTMGDPIDRGPMRLTFGETKTNGTTMVQFFFADMTASGRVLVYRPDTHAHDAALWLSVSNVIRDANGMTWGVISLPVRTSGEQLILNYATTYPPQNARDWGHITQSIYYNGVADDDGLTPILQPNTETVAFGPMR